jgi:hypothetical protein
MTTANETGNEYIPYALRSDGDQNSRRCALWKKERERVCVVLEEREGGELFGRQRGCRE